MNFPELEERDGLRWSALIWPWSRLEATRSVIPFAAMYTPLKNLQNMPPLLRYEPVNCKTCTTLLNPYCRIDPNQKIWMCPFCSGRNPIPPQYSEIAQNNLPAEQIFTTVEYMLPRPMAPPPAFVFVLDTCVSDAELRVAKESLMKAISLVPPETIVGLVSFGKNVNVHVLGFTDSVKSYVLRGDKDYTSQNIKDLLNLGIIGAQAVQGGQSVAVQGATRFLQPISECEFMFTSVLEDLDKDPWPVKQNQRPKRCNYTALSVAVALLESSYQGYGARVVALLGGPPTQDPGKVVKLELGDTLRSHADIERDYAPFYRKAVKAFDTIATRAVNAGHTIDVFSCSLDQVGLYEMRSCVDRTGGYFVTSEAFSHPMFKKSFEMFFKSNAEGKLSMGFQGSMEIHCSREIKIAGVIGPVASMNKSGSNVSQEVEYGIGGTNTWRMCSLDPSTTLSAYFEVVNQHSSAFREGQHRYVQFVTKYQHADGTYRCRVTTNAGLWTEGSNINQVRSSIDQEAAAVLVARLSVWKTENEEAFDILRWLDRKLIHMCSRFATFGETKEAFSLPVNLSLYPQFMFNLRRSQFLQVFNYSPDETAYYRSYLNRENTENALLMIQPTLISYNMSSPPAPALLDVSSIKPDSILLLDTFFYVIVFCGERIAQWRKAGYHEDPQYAALKALLEAPKDDAASIIEERFPYSRYIEADEKGSQARFLLAKLNPSISYNNEEQVGQQSLIYTDDASLQVFMDALKEQAQQSVQNS
mmetsp:Transcript_18739/g.75307  ORF Transcript_18739/g.75307 Transcript_18739/m.75307 type:complete len:756 (-) Transcript_18739:1555-3822(-)